MQAVALRPVLEAAASIKLARLTRDLNFQALALARLPDVIANTAISIALAPLLGVWALIIGSLAGPLAYTGISYWLAPHRPRFSFDWAAIRPLIRFGRWIFLTGVIALLGRSAMKIIVSRELGVAELGLYFLAAKLALIPSEVSQEVIHAVAFPLYARLQNDGPQLARAYRAILVAMMALLLPLCLLLFALSPALVAYVLGPRWQDAVALIRVLALVNLMGLLGDTVLPILNGTGRPYWAAMIECLQSSLLILLTPALIAHYGVLGAALVWLPAVGASQLLCVLFARQIIPRPYQGMIRPAITIGLVAIVGGLLAAGLVTLWPGVAGLMLAGGTAVLASIALLWLADHSLQLGLQANLVLAFPPLARLSIRN
jgi:O-antigen/teichoic acid export membrane protein